MISLSNKIIKFGEYMYRVYDYKEPDDLQLGNAYIFGGTGHKLRIRYVYVLPFMGRLEKGSKEPGIYLNNDGGIHVINPRTDRDKQLYHISRVFEITPETINTELNQYLNDIDLSELKYTGNVFEPKIKENDDVGIKAIRLAILMKQIDFNNYAGRFERPWDRANMKKSLMQDTTLTFSKLKTYADIFDLDYGIIIFDREGAKDPLSKNGKAVVVFNDAPFSIEDENIMVVSNIDDVIPKKEGEE
jgi:hypothetical protein